LITGVIMLSFLTLYGAVLMARMILDADSSARRLITTRSLYLAEGGIQWGRKYLTNNTSATTLGPINYAGGRLTVVIEQGSVRYPNYNTSTNVYRITATAEVGETRRVIEEVRYRGGGSNKQLMYWREAVDDQF